MNESVKEKQRQRGVGVGGGLQQESHQQFQRYNTHILASRSIIIGILTKASVCTRLCHTALLTLIACVFFFHRQHFVPYWKFPLICVVSYCLER